MSSYSDSKRAAKNEVSSFLRKDERFDSLEEKPFPCVYQIPTDENVEKGQENRGSSPFEEDKLILQVRPSETES